MSLTTDEMRESTIMVGSKSLHIDCNGRVYMDDDATDECISLNDAADAATIVPKIAALCLHWMAAHDRLPADLASLLPEAP